MGVGDSRDPFLIAAYRLVDITASYDIQAP